MHNRGIQPANDVKVWAIYCNASAGLPGLNACFNSQQSTFDFWKQFDHDGEINQHTPINWAWKSLGVQTLNNIYPTNPKVASWKMIAPQLQNDWDPGHYCIVVFIHSRLNSLSENSFDIEEIVPRNKQIVQKNLHIISSTSASGTLNISRRRIALQATNGQFVCAEGGGGGQQLVANRDSAASWKTFNLIDFGNGQVALQAANGKYICAESGGGQLLIANRDVIGLWETFNLIDLGNGRVALQAVNGQFVCAESGGGQLLIANRDVIGLWETFNLIDLGNGRVALQAVNGQFVCAEGGGEQALVANRSMIGAWETFNLFDVQAG